MSNHTKGLFITLLGVIILGPDSLFIRLVEADSMTIVFWRGVSLVIGMTVLTLLFTKGSVITQFRSIGTPGLLIACGFSISMVSFVTSINHTAVANTLVIIAASPVFAAILSWIVLREKITASTMLAIALVIIGILLVSGSGLENHSVTGDLLAVVTSMMLAVIFVTSRKYRHINMVPAMAVGGLIAALMTLPFASPLDVSQQSAIYLIILGLIMTFSFSLLVIGPRYIPAYEVSLLMPVETVLGVLLAWWFLNETPPMQAIIGCLVVISTIAIHAYYTGRNTHR